jgi:polysaccharide pyruvyl transferase WcaK-like protein
VRYQPAIALHGFAYSANFGDMLLARLTIDIVRRHAPDAELSLPFATEEFLASAGIDRPAGVRNFLRSDALLYYGGGYLGFSSGLDLSRRASLYRRFYAPGIVAPALGKPYGIFGVGVGPICGAVQRHAARRLFQGASVVSVRDEEGYDWLRRIGISGDNIHLVVDLAASLQWNDVPCDAIVEAERILATVPGEGHIGIHLSAPSDASSEYSAVLRGLLAYADRHPELGIVVFCDHLPVRAPEGGLQHRAAVEFVSRLGPRARFVGQPPLWTLVALLGKLDGLVSNKLHACIVSSAFGNRAVSIAKTGKNRRFYRQIGATSRCISLRDVGSVDVLAFLENGFECLSSKAALPDPVRDLAKKNELLIGQFLEDVSISSHLNWMWSTARRMCGNRMP